MKRVSRRIARLQKRYALLLCFLCLCALLFAFSPPAMESPVNDHAKLLNVGEKQLLTDYLLNLNKTKGIQIVVLTISSLEGTSIEDFSIRTVESWKIGQKEKDNGVLLLIAAAEKKVRIEVGYGLEDTLTDMQSGSIIRNIIAPCFRNGDYGMGIISAVQTMAELAAGGDAEDINEMIRGQPSKGNFDVGVAETVFMLILFFTFMLIGIKKRSRRFGKQSGSEFAKTAAVAALMSSLRSGSGFGGFSGGGRFGGGGASGGW